MIIFKIFEKIIEILKKVFWKQHGNHYVSVSNFKCQIFLNILNRNFYISVYILRLKWGSYRKPDPSSHLTKFGWGIQILGLPQSDRVAFLNQVGGDTVQGGLSGNDKPASILTSPWQQQEFCTDHGAMCTELPLDWVTDYLNSLGDMGYKVMGSVSVMPRENQVTVIWTLQKNW